MVLLSLSGDSSWLEKVSLQKRDGRFDVYRQQQPIKAIKEKWLRFLWRCHFFTFALGNLEKTISLLNNSSTKENHSRAERRQEAGNCFHTSAAWLRRSLVDKKRRCFGSEIQSFSSSETYQSRGSQGLLLECVCASIWIPPSHTLAHVAAGWSLFTSLQRALQSRTISDFIIPLFACTSMNPSQALESHRSPDLNDCPQEQLVIHAFMYVLILWNMVNEVCTEMRSIKFWLKRNGFCFLEQ